ncbi:hypothetical protein [Varibaculum prostatecancerukia]|uniref:hypothetical protein n=1 Tax=Varibaculum prostatecancerukia TaxID=2811781 RepID=UPI00203F839C|nr:hypothetical protein [Varibaculum prostatecancerukia]
MNTKEPECSVEEENTERLIGRANRLGYTITSIEIEPGRVAISIVPSPLFPTPRSLTGILKPINGGCKPPPTER